METFCFSFSRKIEKRKTKSLERIGSVCLTGWGTSGKEINNEKKQTREDRRLCTPEPWMWEHGRNPGWAWKRETQQAPEYLCVNLPRSHPEAGE